MKKMTFIGDPSDGMSGPYGKDGRQDSTVTFKGITFKKDEPVEVDDDIAVKLSSNPHFEVEADKVKPNKKNRKNQSGNAE